MLTSIIGTNKVLGHINEYESKIPNVEMIFGVFNSVDNPEIENLRYKYLTIKYWAISPFKIWKYLKYDSVLSGKKKTGKIITKIEMKYKIIAWVFSLFLLNNFIMKKTIIEYSKNIYKYTLILLIMLLRVPSSSW